MKNSYLYLLSLLLLLATGCLKNDQDMNITGNYPLGVFEGKFSIIHRSLTTLKYDTVSSDNLKLTLSVTGYTVTGDTTIHAASYGGFLENNANMAFNDLTYPASGTPKKTHLSGNYIYDFDGTNLKIGSLANDTLAYVYDLLKISN